jgi:hypothetical protein
MKQKVVYTQGTWDKNGETKITLLLMHKLLQVKLLTNKEN